VLYRKKLRSNTLRDRIPLGRGDSSTTAGRCTDTARPPGEQRQTSSTITTLELMVISCILLLMVIKRLRLLRSSDTLCVGSCNRIQLPGCLGSIINGHYLVSFRSYSSSFQFRTIGCDLQARPHVACRPTYNTELLVTLANLTRCTS
jgi:hypothetical protein